MTTKITSANIDTTSVATATSANTANFNIALLGFKMAITEGLTVFNLIDGIVDEFEDEGGTDGSASTNLTYNSTDDYYINSNTPDGGPSPGSSYSAGFGITSVTEPDTSTAGTNPGKGVGTSGVFTVPSNLTSVNVYNWGAGGGTSWTGYNSPPYQPAGGGGFSSGTLTVSPGQSLYALIGEGGHGRGQCLPNSPNAQGLGGGGREGGGGLTAILTTSDNSPPQISAPQVYIVAGAGGSSGGFGPSGTFNGGSGGGLTGCAAGTTTEQTNSLPAGPQPQGNAGGGSQTVGGQSAPGIPAPQGAAFFRGGDGIAECGADIIPAGNGGGGGYYGGGAGGRTGGPMDTTGGGGGGSSYYGHPQITSGSTEEGGPNNTGGGVASPLYVAGTNEGGDATNASPSLIGEDGYILITGTSSPVAATATSSTIISDPFTSNTVPTNTRIVVFEENVGSPTLNTDIIASVSRNGGTNFTTVTLTDSGYVTGSSGQRILTGQASVSGQPSGQSMKWKLQLANQTVKIHGVSLQWS